EGLAGIDAARLELVERAQKGRRREERARQLPVAREVALEHGAQQTLGDEVIEQQRESRGRGFLVDRAGEREQVEEPDGREAFGDRLEGEFLQAVGEALGRSDDGERRERIVAALRGEGLPE